MEYLCKKSLEVSSVLFRTKCTINQWDEKNKSEPNETINFRQHPTAAQLTPMIRQLEKTTSDEIEFRS